MKFLANGIQSPGDPSVQTDYGDGDGDGQDKRAVTGPLARTLLFLEQR